MDALIDVQLCERPVEAIAIQTFPAECGGECVFIGRTRIETHERHGLLERLSYEAYRPMAERTLRDLAEEAVRRFGCAAVRIHHAIGEVPPGAGSVLVQVAAGHRAEAFDACRFLIDRLKAEAPIWKREVWQDGTTWSQGTPVEMTRGRGS